MSPLGTLPIDPIMSASATNYTAYYTAYFPVKLVDQPIRITPVFAPYTSLQAAATAGSARVVCWVVYDDSNDAPFTQRAKVQSISVVSGANSLGPQLAKGLNTTSLAFRIGSEANISYVTFSLDGKIEVEQIDVGLITVEDSQSVAGHQINLEPIRMSAGIISDATTFDLNTTAADTINLIQLYVT